MRELIKFISRRIRNFLLNHLVNYNEQPELFILLNRFGIPYLANGWCEIETNFFGDFKYKDFIWALFKFKKAFKYITTCKKVTKLSSHIYHFENGILHNTFGPAYWDINSIEYYLDNNYYHTQEEWYLEILKRYPEHRKELLFNQDILLNKNPGFWMDEISKELAQPSNT